ncbi:unnamed protein product [Rotaria magnacalcarata]
MNQTRSKQSFHYDYIVKHNGSILEQTFVSIEWRNNRERRAAQKSPSTNLRRIITSTTQSSIILRKNIKNRTLSLNKNKIIKPTYQKQLPKLVLCILKLLQLLIVLYSMMSKPY